MRLGLVALVLLTGCASTTLPYTPARQPTGARVSAAYQLVADRVRIEVAGDGRLLEEASIERADGFLVRPQAIERTPGVARSSPISIGFGLGSATYGSSGAVGTGIGVEAPVGGASTTEGNTFVVFPASETGPPPWRLHVKLAGVEPVVILVGTPPSGTR